MTRRGRAVGAAVPGGNDPAGVVFASGAARMRRRKWLRLVGQTRDAYMASDRSSERIACPFREGT